MQTQEYSLIKSISEFEKGLSCKAEKIYSNDIKITEIQRKEIYESDEERKRYKKEREKIEKFESEYLKYICSVYNEFDIAGENKIKQLKSELNSAYSKYSEEVQHAGNRMKAIEKQYNNIKNASVIDTGFYIKAFTNKQFLQVVFLSGKESSGPFRKLLYYLKNIIILPLTAAFLIYLLFNIIMDEPVFILYVFSYIVVLLCFVCLRIQNKVKDFEYYCERRLSECTMELSLAKEEYNRLKYKLEKLSSENQKYSRNLGNGKIVFLPTYDNLSAYEKSLLIKSVISKTKGKPDVYADLKYEFLY